MQAIHVASVGMSRRTLSAWGERTIALSITTAALAMPGRKYPRMKTVTYAALGLAIAAVLLVAVLMPKRAEAAGTVGNGSPGSCTEAALAGGGLVTFNCGTLKERPDVF